METVTIRKPDDFHVHLRQGELTRKVLPHTARQFARALVMPNLLPPVATHKDVVRYLAYMRKLAPSFRPLMTIKLLEHTTPKDITNAKRAGVLAAKLYPRGVTTNAHDGVSDLKALAPVLARMEEVGMVLSIHAEMPGTPVLLQEKNFRNQILEWYCQFRELKMVVEHVSTSFMVDEIRWTFDSRVAATVTAHHLVLTLDDVIGSGLQPHNFCKPVAKTASDREALLQAVYSGNPKFFFGSDSAPHPKNKKEGNTGAAGCYTSPIALPLLAEIFEQRGKLGKLEDFVSRFGAEFYGLPLNQGTITLVKQPQRVPNDIDGLVPFRAGEEISWQIVS